MAFTPKYTLVCDEVRQENNGKFIVIGLYLSDMTVPQLPFVLPVLTFLAVVEGDRPGNFQCRFAVQHLETGQEIANGMGMLALQRPGVGAFPVALRNFPINQIGSYIFTLMIDGERNPITAQFRVLLVPPGQTGVVFPPR